MAAPFRAMIRPQKLNDGVATLKGHGKYHWYLVGLCNPLPLRYVIIGGLLEALSGKSYKLDSRTRCAAGTLLSPGSQLKKRTPFWATTLFYIPTLILLSFFSQKAKGGGEVCCEPQNPTSPKAKVGGSLAQIVPGLPADGGAGCDRRGGSLGSAARRDGKPETDSANRRAGKTSSQLVLYCPVQPNYS